MADKFSADRYTPTTVQTLIYSDFTTDLDIHPDIHDLFLKKNEDDVKMALKNLLLTNKYERPFNPTFGGNLRKYLFEPITPATQLQLQEDIKNTIANYEPRVNIINVIVTAMVDENAYSISITYNLVNKSETQTLNTVLYRVR